MLENFDLDKFNRLIAAAEFDKITNYLKSLEHTEIDPELQYYQAYVKQLHGSYHKSNEILNEISTDNEHLQIKIEVMKMYNHHLIGEYPLVGDWLKQIEIDDTQIEMKTKILVLKAMNLTKQSNLDEAILVGKQALTLAKSHDFLQLQSRVSLVLGQAHRLKSQYEIAKAYYETAHQLNEELGYILNLAKSANSLGIIHSTIGDFDKGLKYFTDYYQLSQQIGNPNEIALANLNIGIILTNRGDYQKALAQFLSIYDSEDLIPSIKLSYIISISYCYLRLGQLDKGIELSEEGLLIARRIGNRHAQANCLANIGHCYLRKSELALSIQHLDEAGAIYLDFDNKDRYSEILYYKATIHFLKQDYQLANHLLDRVEQIQHKTQDGSILSLIYYLRAKLLYENDEFNQLVGILDLLHKLDPLPIVNRVIMFVEALTNLTKKSLDGIVKARDLFNDLVYHDEKIDYSIFMDSITYLTDIHLTELKIFDQPEFLGPIIALVELLRQQGVKNNNYDAIVKSILLEAKISLLTGDIQHSNHLLDEAQVLAKDHDLIRMSQAIKGEILRNNAQHNIWKSLLEATNKLSDRLENSDFENILRAILTNKFIYDTRRETPYAFTIFNKYSGLPLYFRSISSSLMMNQHLMSSFLSAMISFGEELTSDSDQIDLIRYGPLSLLFHIEGNLAFVYIFSGNSFSTNQRMINTVETLFQLDIIQAQSLNLSVHEDFNEEFHHTIDIILDHSLLNAG